MIAATRGSAGTLRERVTWQRRTLLPDGAGGNTHLWVSQGIRHAQVLATGGGEKQVNDIGAIIDDLTVMMRFMGAITTTDRLLWRGQTLNIRSIADPDGRRRWMQLTCQTGVPSD